MTDLSTDSEVPSTFLTFELKLGAGLVDVETGKLPEKVYAEALKLGLKQMAEQGTSGITKSKYPDASERKAALKAKAEENIQKMYDGSIKIAGEAKAKPVKGAVMTEAMRLARNLVRDWMKSNKIKIGTVKASQITKAAQDMLKNDPSIIKTAEANLAARAAVPIQVDLSTLIHADPELVAKEAAKAAKAKANKPLSKTQAGKIAPRAKGAKPQAGLHA